MFDSLNSSDVPNAVPMPRWVRLTWLIAAPFAIAFSARILWEKTLLTAREGEQMIGFSLMHVYPFFFLAGVLCSYILLAWLLVAIVYMLRARFRLPWYEYGMIGGSLFVFVAMSLPHDFGLRFR